MLPTGEKGNEIPRTWWKCAENRRREMLKFRNMLAEVKDREQASFTVKKHTIQLRKSSNPVTKSSSRFRKSSNVVDGSKVFL